MHMPRSNKHAMERWQGRVGFTPPGLKLPGTSEALMNLEGTRSRQLVPHEIGSLLL